MNAIYSELVKENGKDILQSENHKNSAGHIQHGRMSVRAHTISVAINSLKIADFLKIKYDRRALIRGALLHDYFQYDWHDKKHIGLNNLHGFKHPAIALENAEKEFELSRKEKDIIKKHMWPLTIKPPMCREAWIVSMADKYCSLAETIKRKKKSKIKIKQPGGKM